MGGLLTCRVPEAGGARGTAFAAGPGEGCETEGVVAASEPAGLGSVDEPAPGAAVPPEDPLAGDGAAPTPPQAGLAPPTAGLALRAHPRRLALRSCFACTWYWTKAPSFAQVQALTAQ